MSNDPLYIEFWLDGKCHACRSKCQGAPHVGDDIILKDGVYTVLERIWDFTSQAKHNQGLRLIIKYKMADQKGR